MDPPQLNNYNKVSDGNSTNPTKETIATNVKGSVKWFHRVKGFGFITRDDTKEDVFVHYTSLKPVSIQFTRSKNRLNLMDKEKVLFDVVKTNDGLEAVNVVGKNGYLILDIIAYKREISPFGLEIINDARVTGKVKWFNVKIKYGFIHCDYNNEDVFVHSSAIIKNNPNKYKASLSEGETVEFDILKRDDGKLEAVNVSGPNGLNVIGSRYSPDKKSTSNKTYVEQSLVGKVKWFNVKAGFGFINRNDNGQDVYVHYSSIENKNPNHRVRSLADGELVKFNLIDGSKGSEAVDVTAEDGGPVQGSEYAMPKNQTPTDGEKRTKMTRKNTKGSNVQGALLPARPYSSTQTKFNRSSDAPNYRQQQQQHQQVAPMRPNYISPKQTRMNNNYQMGMPQYNYGNRMPSHSNPYSNQYNDPNSYMARQKKRQGNQMYNSEQRSTNFSQRHNAHPLNGSYNPHGNSRQINHQFENNRYDNSNGQGYDPTLQNNGFYSQNQRIQHHDSNQMAQPIGTIVATRVLGTVKWYNYKNGFGFVTRSDNNQDIFVHRSGIQDSQPGLDDGEPVEFDILQDSSRLVAVSVTGPNHASLRGSKYAKQKNDQPVPTKVFHRRRVANN